SIRSFASTTALSVRPFTMTRAPSRASPVAMANPMPLVEPETRAVLSASFRFMDRTLRSLEWWRDLVGAAPAKEGDGGRIPSSSPSGTGTTRVPQWAGCDWTSPHDRDGDEALT